MIRSVWVRSVWIRSGSKSMLDPLKRWPRPELPYEHRTNSTIASDGFSSSTTMTRIRQALMKARIPYQNGFTCLRIQCPCCSKTSAEPRAFVNKTSGTFICYECEVVAEWGPFLQALQTGWKIEGEAKHPAFPSEKDRNEIEQRLSDAVEIAKVDATEMTQILKRMKLQRVQSKMLAQNGYYLDADRAQPKILLPLRGYRNKIVGLKYVGEDGNVVETFPHDDVAGFFTTESTLSPNRAVIVTNPFDAMFITQETQLPAIAVGSTARLPVTSLPLLEKYDQLTIWFQHSSLEWENAKAYARKLAEVRCRFIRQVPEYDRPITTKNVAHTLKLESPMLHKSLVTFQELRQQLYDHLMQWEQAVGVKWKRFPGLNKYLKGHRRGELTIFTGQPGAGKTTFLCEYSLDLLQSNVRTLWGSFEISNTRLLKTMITQFALEPLQDHMEKFDTIADSFSELPLYMMRFHGQENIKNVLDAMSHSVYVNDIQHVVLDNLQFMMGVSEDRFHRQDMVVSAMRKFATEHNVHVTLVIHPRKEKEEELLSMASINGTAKASQEADNIMVLQKSPRNTKYIQVIKNRFDGDVGAFALTFDKPTLSFSHRTKSN